MYSSSGPNRLASQRRARSSGLRSPSAFACCASSDETGNTSGLKPSRRSMFSPTNSVTCCDACLVAQEIDLVDDYDDLLAPVPDRLHERPLALSEWAVGGGDEEDHVRARHELLGQLLVLADDRVGARCIDDRDLVEELRRVLAHDDPVACIVTRWSRARSAAG